MQFILGAYPWQMTLGVVAANAICIGAVYYLLCALTGRWVVACLILHLASGLWGAANYFVAAFRGTPILCLHAGPCLSPASCRGTVSRVQPARHEALPVIRSKVFGRDGGV